MIQMDWHRSTNGCAWTFGDYTICSFLEIEGGLVGCSGFRLYFRGGNIGDDADYAELEAAKRAAIEHDAEVRAGTLVFGRGAA